MRVHVVTLVIVDFDGLGPDGIKTELEATRFANDCISPNVEDIQTYDIGPWDDSHPLNQLGTNKLSWLRVHGELSS